MRIPLLSRGLTGRPAGRSHSPAIWVTLLGVMLAVGGFGAADAATSSSPSQFVAMSPCRLLDTRPGYSAAVAPASPIQAHQTLPVQVTGNCGVPAGATAVNINFTITNPGSDSFADVFPGTTWSGSTSRINYYAGETIANAIDVQLSSTGVMGIFNGEVPDPNNWTDAIVDVTGYYLATPAQQAQQPGKAFVTVSNMCSVPPGGGAVSCTANCPSTAPYAMGGGYNGTNAVTVTANQSGPPTNVNEPPPSTPYPATGWTVSGTATAPAPSGLVYYWTTWVICSP